jgi:hypothetical protein
MKAGMIRKYDGGHSLSATARELGFAALSVNTIVRHATGDGNDEADNDNRKT